LNLLLLISPKVLSFRNSVNLNIVLRRTPFLLIGAGFWWLLYLGTYYMLTFIREIGISGDMIAEKLFSMIFSGLFGFLLLSNIITGLSSFYLSKDIPYFLSKPVSIGEILWLKTTEAVINSSWMVVSFIPPVFMAYGVVYKAPGSFYVMLIAGLLMLVLTAAGLGISIAHLLTRLFPAKMTRDVFLVIGLLLFTVLYFMLRSAMPADPGAPEDLRRLFMSFRSDSPLLPGFWMARGLFPVLRGGGAIPFYLMVLASNASFFLLLASIAGHRVYLTNIGRLQPSASISARSFLSRWYPGPQGVMVYKDLNIFFRDAGQWSQLLIIGALVLIYLNNFRSIPVEALSGVSPFITEIMMFLNMLMAGLVLTAVAARFIFPLVSLEGEAFWVVRTAPVRLEGLIRSKLTCGSVPVTCMISLLVLAANYNLRPGGAMMLISSATVLLLCVAVSGLATGMGAIYPRFRYENIASVSVSTGSLLFMIFAFGLVCGTLALEALAFYMVKVRPSNHIKDMLIIFLCGAAIAGMNAAAFFIPLKLGVKRLYRLNGE